MSNTEMPALRKIDELQDACSSGGWSYVDGKKRWQPEGCRYINGCLLDYGYGGRRWGNLTRADDEAFGRGADVAEWVAGYEREEIFAGVAEDCGVLRLDDRD